MDSDKTSLRKLAEQHGLLVGASIGPRAFEKDPEYGETLAREYNCTVCENVMKMKTIHPERDRYDFEPAERLLAFAEQHGMKMRGHTLAWHHPGSLPDWFKETQWSESEAKAILEDHARTVVGHFRGRVFAWDVVNEGIGETTPWREDSPWYRALGPDYVAMAFRAAHEADPDALLFHNDYEMDAVNEKADRCYDMVKGLLERGVPIHGVGLQYHVTIDALPESASVAENIRRFNDLGLAVHVTEMDIWLKDNSPASLAMQADAYRAAIRAVIDAADCQAFITWGFTDRHSWVPGFSGREYGWALPFDEAYRPKPAYDALREELERG